MYLISARSTMTKHFTALYLGFTSVFDSFSITRQVSSVSEKFSPFVTSKKFNIFFLSCSCIASIAKKVTYSRGIKTYSITKYPQGAEALSRSNILLAFIGRGEYPRNLDSTLSANIGSSGSSEYCM